MELKTTKEFVLKAHSEACDKLKKEIEKEFPEAFEIELQVGKWYKNYWVDDSIDKSFTIFVRFERIDMVRGGIIGNGFNTDGVYKQNNSWGENDSIWELATSKEIETMLWREAEKRGIGKDTKIEFHADNSHVCAKNDVGFQVAYYIMSDSLWNNYGCVYHKGKWTKPLDPNKELKEQIETMEKELQKLKERINN